MGASGDQLAGSSTFFAVQALTLAKSGLSGTEAAVIANMKQNRVSAVEAWCEGPGCHHRVSIPLEEIYAVGFTDADAVIDVGWKLRCSKCRHKGATTQPDWTTRRDPSVTNVEDRS